MADEFPQTCNISQMQTAELVRFVKLGYYTTKADALRQVLKEGTDVVLRKHGLKPVDVEV